MKIIFSLLLSIFLLFINITQAQKAQVVYDPAGEAEYKSPAAETELVKNAILPALGKIWTEEVCSESLTIAGKAQGAFTKAGSGQTAYLFEYCVTGNGLANDVILIVENGKTVALYTFEGGEPVGLSKLADIDQNKTDEMVINWMGGMHSGEIGSAAVVLQITAGNLTELVAIQSSWSVCDGDVSTIKCGYANKITAIAGSKPVYFTQKMVGEGNKWRAAGKAVKAKFINTTAKYEKVKLR